MVSLRSGRVEKTDDRWKRVGCRDEERLGNGSVRL